MVETTSDDQSHAQAQRAEEDAAADEPAAQQSAASQQPAAPQQPAAAKPAQAPAPNVQPTPTREELILRGLGFCGHYLHFHEGGRSGREPILCMLHRAGGSMSQLELGSRFELKPGSLSEILAKIETAGLIERTRDPRDRRALSIHLTEAGEQEALRAIEARKAFRDQAFSNLTVEEQDELVVLLGKIRNRWEELA